MKIFRHYKGGLYTVIGEAEHTELGAEFLVIYANSGGQLFARPVDSFYGDVNGSPRFREVGFNDLLPADSEPAKCVACGGESTVIESRRQQHYTRRRRECLECGARWTTLERRAVR